MTSVASLPANLSEHHFQRTVIDLARLHGWRVSHTRPARTERGWRTPVEGDAGAPDLLLARDGAVLLAELKSARGRPAPDQVAWLAALGPYGRLWRPADFPTIAALLARPTEGT